ncbi:MAG: acryloyl-CoA reductase [Candidatus Parcubacteria bacterium]|nr:acryloyl-CoA reductase [Burkholderiales bacterium]
MGREEMDAGEVVVRMAYASVNYKDALTARGKAKIAMKFPLVAGIDLAGTVEQSTDARHKPGDEVIVHSFGLGAEHDGGYAEYGRFPADWVIPLPRGMTLFDASALGVAGHTAALAIDLMELNGLTPAKGKVLVNGATGGVASIAIDILAGRGYHVVAMSGKAEQVEYLRGLGAKEVIGRGQLEDSGRPLERALWAGAVDSVGGAQMSLLARSMQRDGVIAAFGNAGGAEFAGNVLPFILRGVRLLGVNVNNPFETMQRLWGRLAGDLKPRHLERIARRIRFEELESAFDELLAARVTGRMVVDFSLR